MVERFTTVYLHSARFCVMFVSIHYRDKVWPSHECESALARALKDKEYLLPVRFDDTAIPGLLPTVGYVDANAKTPVQLADMITEKLSRSMRDTYFPPNPIALAATIGAENNDTEIPEVYAAFGFFEALKLMKPEERKVIFLFFIYACPAELPENLHIYQNLLSRVSHMSIADIGKLLGEVSSLGFVARQRRGHGDVRAFGDERMFELQWHDRSINGVGNATYVASEAIWLVMEGKCEKCAMQALMRLDFGALGEPRQDMAERNDLLHPGLRGDGSDSDEVSV